MQIEESLERFRFEQCCEKPDLSFVRDERVEYATTVDGDYTFTLVPRSGVSLGKTYDDDDPEVTCRKCGRVQPVSWGGKSDESYIQRSIESE